MNFFFIVAEKRKTRKKDKHCVMKESGHFLPFLIVRRKCSSSADKKLDNGSTIDEDVLETSQEVT